MVKPPDDLACVKCGALLTRPPTGRPPRYCSTACRRVAEYEVRRLQRHLEREERLEAQWRRDSDPDTRFAGGSVEYATRMLAVTVAEIARLEARLRELLDDGQGG